MKVKTEMAGVPRKIRKIATNNQVGLFLASEIERQMVPYVPMDTGMLYQTTQLEPFRVIYEQEYGKAMYYGEGLNFRREKHPLATAHWDRAMIVAKKNDIASAVSEYIKRL